MLQMEELKAKYQRPEEEVEKQKEKVQGQTVIHQKLEVEVQQLKGIWCRKLKVMLHSYFYIWKTFVLSNFTQNFLILTH